MQVFQNQPQQRFFHMPRFNTNFQKTNNYFNVHQYKQHLQQNQSIEFDGKRLRKAVVRKTIDYNSAIINQLQARVWQRDYRDQRALQPDSSYYTELVPPMHLSHNPINSVTTKFVRTSTNKMRCPIFCVAWTPEGRRLVTGASSGEFTLWNGLTFNFETILQAHDSPVRCMVWSHNDTWMVTGDHSGYVKYWQSNMNNVKMFQAHKEPLRGISFCPTDQKFATCSDDGTVRVWDFLRCNEEKILRGHGADVKCVDWHPQKGLIVSGSKDSQQPIKLWDPKNGQSLATLHAHKSTVMEVRWNLNGNWMLTASRDHLVKLFDIRNLSQEVQTFRGHKKEVSSLAWHPTHESLFASGGSDGSVMFWVVGADKEVGAMEQAHDSIVWSLAWHPLGHILCSGSNDHSSKFWTRNRPGDRMRDKYNLNILSGGGNVDDLPEYDEPSASYVIPGMGLEHSLNEQLLAEEQEAECEMESAVIPGLDFGSDGQSPLGDKPTTQKKVPYAKPIPRQFQQQWLENKRPLLAAPPKDLVSPPGDNSSEQSSTTAAAAPPDNYGGPRILPAPIHNRGDMTRMETTGNRFNNEFRNRNIGKDNFQDIDQRDMFFRDQFHQMEKREFGDSDFRPYADRGNNFAPTQRQENESNDPRLRLRSAQDPYQDYDSREFGGNARGGRSTNRRMDFGDSDLRVRDDGRRLNESDKNNSPSPGGGDNYSSRKRNWDDGPGEQRGAYYGGRENLYSDSGYGDAGGGGGGGGGGGSGSGSGNGSGRGRGRGRNSFRGMPGRGRTVRGYQ